MEATEKVSGKIREKEITDATFHDLQTRVNKVRFYGKIASGFVYFVLGFSFLAFGLRTPESIIAIYSFTKTIT